MGEAKIPLLKLYVDGASRGNPGPAAGGIVLTNAEGAILAERGCFFGESTNNVAEYNALLRGLELAGQFAPDRLEIFADSELVVRQITGAYRVKSPDLAPLHERAQTALLRFDNWQITHIPRSRNARADELADLAIKARADVDDAADAPAAAETAAPPEAGPAVLVKVTLGCDPRVCPATMMVGETFKIAATTPDGLCVYAAGALLPAVLGLLNAAAVVDKPRRSRLQLTCPRPGCNAKFDLRLTDDA